MYISEITNRFLEYREVNKNNSKCTIDAYKGSLRKFIAWTGDKQIEEVNLPLMNQYIIYLKRSKTRLGDPISVKTQREHLIAIRALLKYCHVHDIPTMSLEKIDLPDLPEIIVTYLTSDEVAQLLEAVNGTSLIELRNRAVLETLYSTGLRITELLSLDRDKIDLRTRQFSVLGKGRKVRLVFLSDQAANSIQRYLDARTDKYKPLFIDHSSNTEGGRLTKRSAARMIKDAAEKAKIQKTVTCHKLRHSFATDLMINGADIRSVQELLGHASIKTTQMYTHVTNARLQNIFNKYHNKHETFI